jgi:O-methyltransferase
MRILLQIFRKVISFLNLEISKGMFKSQIHSHIISSVQNRTMTCESRLLNLLEIVDYIIENNIDGSFVECGVWRGGSSIAVAMNLKNRGISDRKIYLFDTFAGMTLPSSVDFLSDNKSQASSLLAKYSDKKDNKGYSKDIRAISGLEDVLTGFRDMDIELGNLRIIEGDVLKTLNIAENVPEKISLLRLDTDFYDSTLLELQVLWPRLSNLGVLIIDDYDYWNGARLATDEYFASLGIRPLMFRMKTGRVILK